MSQTPERKNRFQISREVQEEFVNSVGQTMLKLVQAAEQGKLTFPETQAGVPFSAANGKEYGGANMARLMLAGMEKGYTDDRWMTYKQFEQYQKEHPDQKMGFKKGQHGIKLLRPEEIFFTVDEAGKWNFLSQG